MKCLGLKWVFLLKKILPTLFMLTVLMTVGCGGSENSDNKDIPDRTDTSTDSETDNGQNAIQLIISPGDDPKTLAFQWNADLAEPVDHYRLEVDPDGVSGFGSVQGADHLISPDFDLVVPLHLIDWWNIRYRVVALDESGNQLAASAGKGPLESVDPVDLIGYFKAGNAESGDEFGRSVALSADGSTLAVGAPGEGNPFGDINNPERNSNGASNAGAVYMFVKDDTGVWRQEAYIKASDPEEGDEFGNCLDLSADGNMLIVGAHNKDFIIDEENSIGYVGAAYVYQRNNMHVWWEETKLMAGNFGFGDHFGWAVAISADGGTLAVGAYHERSNSSEDPLNDDLNLAGAVYTFNRDDSGNWTESNYLKARIPGHNDYFGSALALSADGAALAVGAYGENSASTTINGDEENNDASSSGAVYLFSRTDNNVYIQEAFLKAHNTSALAEFGKSISLSSDGNTLAVGATGESSAATGINNPSVGQAADSGAAYIFFRENEGEWRQEAFIKADISTTDYYFGIMVALTADGNTLLVGASGDSAEVAGINVEHNHADAVNVGAAFLFNRDSRHNWTQITYLKASNPAEYNYFGVYGDISGDGNT